MKGKVAASAMKYVMVILSGAADRPIEDLGDVTPLAVADTPNLSRLTKMGRLGTVRSIPQGLASGPVAGSMALLGIDPRTVSVENPAYFEAIASGVELDAGEWVIACDFVTVDDEDGRLVDVALEGIGESDARLLLEALANGLNAEIGDEAARGLSFVPLSGIGSGGLLIDRSGARDYTGVDSQPATALLGSAIRRHLPRGGKEASALMQTVMRLSGEIFLDHEVTATRAELGEPAITQVWLHSPASPRGFPEFAAKYRVHARLLADSLAILGLGQALGMEVAAFENPDLLRFMEERRQNAGLIRGAGEAVNDDIAISSTSSIASVTNGEGREIDQAAEPSEFDLGMAEDGYRPLVEEVQHWLSEASAEIFPQAPALLVIHISSPDIASHHGDFLAKIAMLERLDRQLIGPIFEQLQSSCGGPEGDWRMMVLADHLASSATRLDAADPVPFVMAGRDVASIVDRELFNEEQASRADLHIEAGHDLMEYFLIGGLRGR